MMIRQAHPVRPGVINTNCIWCYNPTKSNKAIRPKKIHQHQLDTVLRIHNDNKPIAPRSTNTNWTWCHRPMQPSINSPGMPGTSPTLRVRCRRDCRVVVRLRELIESCFYMSVIEMRHGAKYSPDTYTLRARGMSYIAANTNDEHSLKTFTVNICHQLPICAELTRLGLDCRA